MSRSLMLLTVLLVAGCGVGAAVPSGPIPPWRSDIVAAQDEASKAGRPMLLRFTASWCPPCQEMERSVWPTPEAQAALAPVAAIKVDVDDPAAETLARTYGIQGIPALVLVDASGREIARATGFQRLEQVQALVSQAPR